MRILKLNAEDIDTLDRNLNIFKEGLKQYALDNYCGAVFRIGDRKLNFKVEGLNIVLYDGDAKIDCLEAKITPIPENIKIEITLD